MNRLDMSGMARRTLLRALPFGFMACVPAVAQTTPRVPRSGCQTNAWPIEGGLAGLLPVLATIQSLGIQGYETSFRNVRETFSNPGPARAQLEATGLKFIGLHIAAPDQYTRETSIPPIAFLREMADGASALGAENLILSGRGVTTGGRLDQAAFDQKLAALIQLGEYCRSRGVKLAYHHHEDDFLADGREMNEILKYSSPDNISLWFCALSAERVGVNPAHYFERHQRRIAGIHLKDRVGDQQVVLGRGNFDGSALARQVQKAKWKGWLLLEEERGKGRTEFPATPAVRESRQYLQRVFGV